MIRNRLFDPGITPSGMAAECRLSVSYLHRLFAATGTTLGRWIREERLLASDRACEIRDIEAPLRPSLNSLGSRTSRNSADTTSAVLAGRQAKLAPKRATGSEPHNKPDTELSVLLGRLSGRPPRWSSTIARYGYSNSNKTGAPSPPARVPTSSDGR